MTEKKYDGFMIGYGVGVDASCYCTGACQLGKCPNNTWESHVETPEEKAFRLGVKVYEDSPINFNPQNPNPIIGVCGRCSMEVRLNNNTTFCSELNCPAGIGPRVYNC